MKTAAHRSRVCSLCSLVDVSVPVYRVLLIWIPRYLAVSVVSSLWLCMM